MFTLFLPLIAIIIVIIIISTPLTALSARMEAAAHRRAGAAGVPLLNQSGVPYVFQKLQPGSPLLADFNFTEVWPRVADCAQQFCTAILHSCAQQFCGVQFDLWLHGPQGGGAVCGAAVRMMPAARWRTQRCWRVCSRSSTSVPR